MVRARTACVAALVIGSLPFPAGAAPAGPTVTLATGTFAAAEAAGNGMTCSGLPTRTCTHYWDATMCFEGAGGSEIGMRSCDVHGGGKTVGTGTRTSTGDVLCTTSTANDPLGSVLVTSWATGTVDVPVFVAHTDGGGAFRGARVLLDRTVHVEGTFTTVGYDPYPCGTTTRGSMSGSFRITTP